MMLKGVPQLAITYVRALLRKKSVLVASGVILVIAATIGLAAQIPSVRHAAALATTHKPEAYTELYFQHAATLPTRVTANKSTVVSFVISNHESSTTTYQYQVTIVDDSLNQAVSTNTAYITLRDKQTRIIPVRFVFPIVNNNYSLEVQLVNRSEAIKFRSRT